MENQEPTYDFLYQNYSWPEPDSEADCPYSGIALQLNEQRHGYNGKPWTCPQCIWYFSQDDLKNPADYEGKDCPYTLKQKAEAAAAPEGESPGD